MNNSIAQAKGFTLVEMAVVLVITGLIIGGLFVPLSAQFELRNKLETKQILENAKEALIGYAMVNERLPCPASATSNGQESFAGGGNASNGNCSNFNDGFLPSATLGLSPVDAQGFGLDAWGSQTQNRLRYAVSSANTNALTTTGGIKNIGISAFTPDLQICSSADCAVGTILSTNGVVVVYSIGKNASTGGISTDEAENPNPQSSDSDNIFVSHEQTPLPNEFDDVVTWISPNIFLSRMISAGKLP